VVSSENSALSDNPLIEFEHQRLVIRGVGLRVDSQVAQRLGTAAGGEEIIAAMRAFGPLPVVVNAAGRVMRAIGG
jgi:hypothetical protein